MSAEEKKTLNLPAGSDQVQMAQKLPRLLLAPSQSKSSFLAKTGEPLKNAFTVETHGNGECQFLLT